MLPSNRSWLPRYCSAEIFLPPTRRVASVFLPRPYLFQDFVSRAFGFLESEQVRKMGFVFDPQSTLPCKWKCADEALFGVDLCLFAQTGQYPFDKGRIGGKFNELSVGAAVHHAPINIDFGGSHVGFIPGAQGGRFGYIPRPLYAQAEATDCGAMMALLSPFRALYQEACESIRVIPQGSEVWASVPNDYLHPAWSSRSIKLLVDLESFASDIITESSSCVACRAQVGRTLLRLRADVAARIHATTPFTGAGSEGVPIAHLHEDWFQIFDSKAVLNADGIPVEPLLPHMKSVLASTEPFALEAALANTCLEVNRLSGAHRATTHTGYAFASFSGVFVDMFDEKIGNYLNLFQPVSIMIKPAGSTRAFELDAEEIHHEFSKTPEKGPVHPFSSVLGYEASERLLDAFTYRPRQ